MDTNDLTEKAYEILAIAESINHTLTVQIGAMCGRYRTEDQFLKEVIKLIRGIANNPEEFMDDWDLWDEIDVPTFVSGLSKLRKYVNEVMKTPISDRGLTIEEIDFG
jgi:hypothetical protein